MYAEKVSFFIVDIAEFFKQIAVFLDPCAIEYFFMILICLVTSKYILYHKKKLKSKIL